MSAGPWRLLIVDDNEDNRLTLSERLAREGYRDVETAADGQKALELIERQPFDLVLLDIMMPRMNGYQMLEALHANPKHRATPVIVISAIDQMESVIRCIELGAEDYLPKPFNPTLLRARVNAILEKKRLRDEIDRHVARIDQELKLAREIQLSMVPASDLAATAQSPVAVSAVLQPARAVGGDLYDYFWLAPQRLCIAVADVSDKGMAAALFMARAKTALRLLATTLGDGASVSGIMTRLNDELCRDNPHAMFVAMLLCVVDVGAGTLEWCNAGLPPPYIVSPDGHIEARAEAIGCPLGLPVPDGHAAGAATLAPGTSVFMSTDGVTEAANPSGELFGDARLRDALRAAATRTPEEVLASVLAEVERFRAGAEPSDDIAALLCRFRP
jgi:phosphoserine phosphatase RsbU/P